MRPRRRSPGCGSGARSPSRPSLYPPWVRPATHPYRLARDVRWGLTLPLPGLSLSEHEAPVRRAEELGYTDLWSGETNGPDGFTPLALAAAWTEAVRLGTGVVGVFQRGPALLAQQCAAMAEGS